MKALRLAQSFVEVPMDLIERQKGESKAFRVKNFVDVWRTLTLLVALAGSIGAAAMAQRRCNERPVSDQEFLTIAKIVI